MFNIFFCWFEWNFIIIFIAIISRFIKINRSCIVNGDKVVEYDQNENKITLKNGFTSFDISRDNRKNILLLFDNKK